MQGVLTKFCKLIWTNMYYESLRNVTIQKGVSNRPKLTYYITSSMNNSENSRSTWFYRFTNFGKNAKTHS